MTEPAVQPRPAPPAPTARPALVVADATREFGRRRVLGPVTLALDPGAVAVVVGANGAGKTTLLRLAAGLLAPTSGVAHRPGRAVYLRPGAGARRAVTVRRAVTHLARLTGVHRDELDRLVTDLCRLTGLAELTGRRVGELSTGQHARLTAALAIAAQPTLACLDEPTAHLDPGGTTDVLAAVRRLRTDGAAVLLASHAPDAFVDIADAVLRIDAGQLQEIRC